MIQESIVTTLNPDGSVNISPMGPTVSDSKPLANGDVFELRPFPTSQTFANLKRTRQGILHITDDVLLLAQAAIGKIESPPVMVAGKRVSGEAIADACRWYEFELQSLDESQTRMSLNCRIIHAHRQRDFFGFNRAKHAVIEAAILATRLDFLPPAEITEQFERLEIIVSKTGGPIEHRAFELLKQYVSPS